MTRVRRIVSNLLRAAWRASGEPTYRRLFGTQFQAGINRLNSALGQLLDVRSQLAEVHRELVDVRASQERLDGHVRSMLASHWDTTAMARRLATIEDTICASPVPESDVQLQGRAEAPDGVPPASVDPATL
jgi:transposase